jgi:ubiquinol-cytochrome c reductase cytochrome c subunit
MKPSLFLTACALSAGLLAGPASALAQSAEKGRVAYTQNGCWQCHGWVGQGGITGPSLAPDPKPYEFMEVFLRHTKGPMPQYSEKILSKGDLADIHAYLKTIPKGPDYKTIPLLN